MNALNYEFYFEVLLQKFIHSGLLIQFFLIFASNNYLIFYNVEKYLTLSFFIAFSVCVNNVHFIKKDLLFLFLI